VSVTKTDQVTDAESCHLAGTPGLSDQFKPLDNQAILKKAGHLHQAV